MENYFQKEMETMPRERMQQLQSERLVEQVRHVYDRVKFYRERMDAADINRRISMVLRTCTSCRLLKRMTCGISIPMACWENRWRTVCGFNPLPAPQDAGWWLFIRKRM